MKLITSRASGIAINLDMVNSFKKDTFTTRSDNKLPSIQFYFNERVEVLVFNSEQERDRIFNDLTLHTAIQF